MVAKQLGGVSFLGEDPVQSHAASSAIQPDRSAGTSSRTCTGANADARSCADLLFEAVPAAR